MAQDIEKVLPNAVAATDRMGIKRTVSIRRSFRRAVATDSRVAGKGALRPLTPMQHTPASSSQARAAATASRSPRWLISSDFNPAFAEPARLDTLRRSSTRKASVTTWLPAIARLNTKTSLYQNHLAKQAKSPLPYPNVEAPDVVAKPWNSFHNFGLAADFTLKNDADAIPRLQSSCASVRSERDRHER